MFFRTNDLVALTLNSSNTEISTLTSTLTVESGSLSEPAYTSDIDANTGIYFPTANAISLGIGGNLRHNFNNTTHSFTSSGHAVFNLSSSATSTTDSTINMGSQTAETGGQIKYDDGTDTMSMTASSVLGFSVDGNSINSFLATRAQNGIPSLPAYSFTSDPNTGVQRIGSDHMGFSAGGASRMSIDGNSINIIEPILAHNGTAAAPAYSFTSLNDMGMYRRDGGSVGFSVNGVEKFFAGLNQNRSSVRLETIDGTASAPGFSFLSDTNTGMGRVSNSIILFYNGANIIEGSSTGVRLLLDGTTFGVDLCSQFSSGTSGIDNCSSSLRYKENVIDLPDAESSKIWDLRPVKYDWKESGETNYGFVAEEVYEVLPELTYYNTKPGPTPNSVEIIKGVDGEPEIEGVHYKHMTALLLSEMKKLKARIEQLENP